MGYNKTQNNFQEAGSAKPSITGLILGEVYVYDEGISLYINTRLKESE